MHKYLNILFIITLLSCDNNKKISDSSNLSKVEANNLRNKLVKSYISEIKAERIDENNNKVIKINDLKLKYELRFFGEKPIDGWELFFSLHGGGGVPDSINENAWKRHKTLYKLKNGILLTPRSPTNTWNMWHQDHVDLFLNKLIQNMIAFYDVNPNKIYLMGYSAGGDGVYQLAPRMADRFAAAAMMAGHPNETSPIGLRNIAFTIHMGENDSAYDRNNVAIDWGKQLKILRENDKNGYSHLVKIHQDKGHWMGGLDSSAISWISAFDRNPFPKRVVWKQDDVTHNRFYWLAVDKPDSNAILIANINKQTVNIEKTTVKDFIIRLNDHLVDMDKRVIVRYLGEEIFNGIVPRSTMVILSSIEEYGDPESVYFGEIPISLKLNE